MLAFAERYSPGMTGALLATFAWFGLPRWLLAAADSDVNLALVLGPVFDLSTFSAGMLFTIYVLALGPSGTFIRKIFKTKAFARFHTYVSVGIISSIALSLATIFYIVWGLPEVASATEMTVASAWFFILGFASMAVVRVVAVFLVFVGADAGPAHSTPSETSA